MAKTDSPRNRREREAARRRAQEEARVEAYRRAARRRGIVGIGVVAGVLLAVFGVVRAATSEQERRASTTTTRAGNTTSTFAAGPPAELPTVAPGEVIEGAAPCPPPGGTRRVTRFGQPPPDCLDPAVDYSANIRTSKGPLTIDLQEDTAKAGVNTFVFLARYHYYDGLPFTLVRRGAFAQVADPVDADGSPGPGFRQPATRTDQVMTSLLVGLTPSDGTTGGGLTIGMPGDQVASTPRETTVVGLILDARVDRQRPPDEQRTVQQLINDAASSTGAPTEVITVEGIDIIEEPRN